MNQATLNYVHQHADDDVRMLALRGSKDPEVDLAAALQQIQGRQTARRKLPSWAAVDAIVYPPHLNMEQCSSEQTARYKATLCRRLLAVRCDAAVSHLPSPSHPSTLFDLTGGLGVDFAFMSKAFDEATYVERNPQLFAISSENLRLLTPTARCLNADGLDVLRQTNHASVIYLDPARRDDHGSRTYGIADCTPNVLKVKDELLEKADFIVLKLSPMLDWRKAVSDLGETFVREVHVVAVGNECKELLLVLSARGEGLRLFCANDNQLFSPLYPELSASSEQAPHSVSPAHTAHTESLTGAYLYEPNASIKKAGCFAAVAQAFGVVQLAPNSHLFVSDSLVNDFPGRRFQISAVSSMNKRDIKQQTAELKQANITTRNFPLSVAELRKRLKLSDGGDTYIFATTLANGDHVLLMAHAPI